MAMKLTVTGKPINIRPCKFENQQIFCLDFEEQSKSIPPKTLPKPGQVAVTAILSEKQWKKLQKSIDECGDTLQNANKLMIQGEVTLDLPMDIVEGDMGLICFQAQYVPKKDNVENDKKQDKKVKASKDEKSTRIKDLNAQQPTPQAEKKTKGKQKTHDKKEIAELHKRFDGQCQECGQRCDKKVVSIKENAGEKTIICPDCKENNTLTFTVGEKLVSILIEDTNMSEHEALQYFTEFPKKYALVYFNDNGRTYWTWDGEQPITSIYCSHKGHIFEAVNKNGEKLRKKANLK
ncbi:hypothetical protein V1503_24395 [Bacillus sp. SCS-151]|uniref:hypothetical protein n=1 Tax=Nanhaiella sioensis TaxID=3115293 RepID=UPI00397E32D9